MNIVFSFSRSFNGSQLWNLQHIEGWLTLAKRDVKP